MDKKDLINDLEVNEAKVKEWKEKLANWKEEIYYGKKILKSYQSRVKAIKEKEGNYEKN